MRPKIEIYLSFSRWFECSVERFCLQCCDKAAVSWWRREEARENSKIALCPRDCLDWNSTFLDRNLPVFEINWLFKAWNWLILMWNLTIVGIIFRYYFRFNIGLVLLEFWQFGKTFEHILVFKGLKLACLGLKMLIFC